MNEIYNISVDLVRKIIYKQFPEYQSLTIQKVEKQGHDNRSYRLGCDMLIRMPSSKEYAQKIPIEQELLLKLAPFINIKIPKPIKIGQPSKDYPYPFSIYKYLPGKSLNLMELNNQEKEQLAYDLAKFLKELYNIKNIPILKPGTHNFYRGEHISVYKEDFIKQISQLTDILNTKQASKLFNDACTTKWNKDPVWIHGDLAIGNILIDQGKLSGIIDFGCSATGDPACDLVITWTYFSGQAREIFIKEIAMDEETWRRARSWALWKASFELCQIINKNSKDYFLQQKIINEVINI